jgi:hypothetical protein
MLPEADGTCMKAIGDDATNEATMASNALITTTRCILIFV